MLNLRQLAKDRWLTQHQVADILGVAQSKVSELMNRPERIRPEIIEKLVEYFGKDVVDAYTTPDKRFIGVTTDAEVTVLSPDTIEEIRKEIEEEVEEAEAFPILPEEVATRLNTDIREYITDNSGELEHINPSQMLRQADMAERILRTSMMPTFQPEDIIFVRFLQDKMKIVDGDIYYIDSKHRPTMIRQIKFTEDGKLRLIAQNPQYGDIIMERQEINNIASIVGLLRMNFSDQYSELENLRRKTDEAMERRNDQMDKILEQQSKLIDFITKTK